MTSVTILLATLGSFATSSNALSSVTRIALHQLEERKHEKNSPRYAWMISSEASHSVWRRTEATHLALDSRNLRGTNEVRLPHSVPHEEDRGALLVEALCPPQSRTEGPTRMGLVDKSQAGTLQQSLQSYFRWVRHCLHDPGGSTIRCHHPDLPSALV